ncbi:peptidoglycan-binding protein [Paenibacillus sp. 2003]|uniref:peptidoglycan-binding protein n=1 Tax=Paenibacillus sp. 2003 TaxID=2817761 RepID=UPI0028607DF8|nr:peptidoglycan-binding protein [Paenibacillus sp. 2003]MDR6717398.1 hypothetical protein [Paenibacillus sp. 2003]
MTTGIIAHNNICAIGNANANAAFTTTWQTSYRLNDVHEMVSVLKENLQEYRATFGASEEAAWGDIPKIDNTSTTFDANTEANVKQFQALVGLDADGIFGARSRNYMAAAIGISPMGWVRVLSQTESLINYNDTPDGARADGVEESCQLDHSWVTTTTSQTLNEIANKFFQQTNYRLQINDCSLIDGHDTPEHSKHDDGRTIDIRNRDNQNTTMSIEIQKFFMQICQDHTNVKEIRYHTQHGLSLSKFVEDVNHKDHFHIGTYN